MTSKVRRNVRMIGAATGMAVALIMVGRGWLIGSHEAPRVQANWTADPWREDTPPAVPVRQTPSRIDPDDFPLVPNGSVSVTNSPAPAPPPTLPASTSARTANLHAKRAAPAPSSHGRAEAEQHYLVQLGTYRLEKNARQDQRRYRALGIDCRLSRSGIYVVLRLSPFDTLDDAKRVAQELRTRGLEPVLLGPRP